MSEKHTGACLCGAVKYDFEGQPLFTGICHCTHCRRQSGSAYSVVVAVAAPNYHQKGETRVYRDKGDSGQALYRHFCGTCGSAITSIADAMPGLVIVKAGTLDHPEQFTPAMEIYCDHAMPWQPAICPDARLPGAPPAA